jgi:hypothetical protein
MSFSRDDPYKYGERTEKEAEAYSAPLAVDTTFPVTLEEWNSMQGLASPKVVLYEMFKRILSDNTQRENLFLKMIQFVKIESIIITNITSNFTEDESIYIQCSYQNSQTGYRETTIEIRISRSNGISVNYKNDTNDTNLNFNPKLTLLENGNVNITFGAVEMDTNSNPSPSVIRKNDIKLASSLLTTISVFAKKGGQGGGKSRKMRKSRKSRRSRRSKKSKKSRRSKRSKRSKKIRK